MKITKVAANNRKRAFEVTTESGVMAFPYAKLPLAPSVEDPIAHLYVDPELGCEGFTFVLESGAEESLHVDAVLEYNEDPSYIRDLLLHELTVEAQTRLERSPLSKREIIRRLGTSASQFYRLLDTTNYTKSVDSMLDLLRVLDCEVEFTVREIAR